MADPFARMWLVSAPWAHPVWHRYVVTLVDLTTDTGARPVKYRPDVTHEMLVFALEPGKSGEAPDGEHGRFADLGGICRLEPANHGYQFVAETDVDALDRIRGLVARIEHRSLSPDTDFRAQWDELFADGVSLQAPSWPAA